MNGDLVIWGVALMMFLSILAAGGLLADWWDDRTARGDARRRNRTPRSWRDR